MARGAFFGRAYPGRSVEEAIGNIGQTRPHSMPAERGGSYLGPKGEYEIQSVNQDGSLVVRYSSGEFAGRTINMSRRIHDSIQFRRQTAQTVVRKEETDYLDLILDILWSKYPALYESEWHENIFDKQLWALVEQKYPAAAEMVRVQADATWSTRFD